MSKEIINTEVTAILPMELIEKAIEGGTVTVEVIESLLALQNEREIKMAKRAFTEAMSRLQAQMPTIKKLKINNGTHSSYAPLEDIREQVKELLSKNGFSYRWNSKNIDGIMTVECIATHIFGHSENSEMSSDIIGDIITKDGKSVMNSVQKSASTITYLKRYTLCNMFGITVADEDLDGRMEKARTGNLQESKVVVAKLLKELGYQLSGEEAKKKIKEITNLDFLAENISDIINLLKTLKETNESN